MSVDKMTRCPKYLKSNDLTDEFRNQDVDFNAGIDFFTVVKEPDSGEVEIALKALAAFVNGWDTGFVVMMPEEV